MNHIRWVAWGVIDVEAMDRQQRRNYLNKMRRELTEMKCLLQVGGSTRQPWYSITRVGELDGKTNHHTAGGADALKKVCAWLLLEVGDHERGEDGSVRGAGAEDEGALPEGAIHRD